MFFFGGIDLNRVPKTIQDNQQSSSARPRHINLFFQFLLSCMIRNLSHKQNRNKNPWMTRQNGSKDTRSTSDRFLEQMIFRNATH